MSKRITIMISDNNLKKAHLRQAREIIKSQKTTSLSKIINEMLEEAKK